jgi:hypothetical protein
LGAGTKGERKHLKNLVRAHPDPFEAAEVLTNYFETKDPEMYEAILNDARDDMANGYVACACGARVPSHTLANHQTTKSHTRAMAHRN